MLRTGGLVVEDPIEFIEEVVRIHLVGPLISALQAAVESYSVAEERGADAYSFGTTAWSYPKRQFQDAIEKGEVPFEKAGDPGFVMRYQGVRIRHHRVGDSDADDIFLSFPRGAKALGRDAKAQLELAFMSGQSAQTFVSDLVVLAYMANEKDGLCAVFLATPGEVEERGESFRVREWVRAVRIWHREADGADPIRVVQPPPAESPQLPVVTRRKKSESESDG